MGLINVTVGGVTKFLPDKTQVQISMLGTTRIVSDYQVPYVEGGSQAIMESDELIKRVVYFDNEIEETTALEFWEDSELRHRSVEMRLKTTLAMLAKQGQIG